MTPVKEEIIAEIDSLPPRKYQEELDLIRSLKSQHREAEAISGTAALASEYLLRKDWFRPEEEEAWSDL